ncbi:MAG TPA: 4Fe-4S binding protein [Terriglobales bacterium]|nr:4Fe-4S binding protein [Terriglobales bacterium]
MARPKTTWPVWLRRTSQSAFLLLFFYFFLQAVYRPINQTGRGVDFFFQLDPLVLLSSVLASHKVAAGLSLSLLTVVVTLLAGRWFCGWVCPFGTLHHLISSWRSARVKERLTVGGYSRWQRSKYYVLFALLVGCVFGLNLTGWFDPFSFLYRSTATIIFPMANDAIGSFFGWIYQTDPGIGPAKVTSVSEPIYEVLRRHFLAASQPHFYGTTLLVLFFAAALFLNLYRARFWCRYVCPLGGLLGVIGKNPLVQIKQNQEVCNDCRLCVADCQGGANPDSAGGWKPSECVYCWNCHSACPHHGIVFAIHVPGGTK